MPRPGRDTGRTSIARRLLAGVALLAVACAHSLSSTPDDTASLADAGTGGIADGNVASAGLGGVSAAGAQTGNGGAGNAAGSSAAGSASASSGSAGSGSAGSGSAGSGSAGTTAGSAGSNASGSSAGGSISSAAGSPSAAGSGGNAGSLTGGAGATSGNGGHGASANSHQCKVTIDLNGYTSAKAGCGNYTTCKGQIHWQNDEAQALTQIVISFSEPKGTTCTADHAGSKWTITDTGSTSQRCTFTASGAAWSVASMAMFGFGYDTTQSNDTAPSDVTISDPSCD